MTGTRSARLTELFGADLNGYHDGAEVPLDVAVELVRLMLREEGGWCCLEADDSFLIHVGWDQYVYVGSDADCSAAVAFTEQHGLYAEPIPISPYAVQLLGDDPVDVRPADATFWADLANLLEQSGAVLLEEGYVSNASRWHRLTPQTVQPVREKLAPRARLNVWPDLNPDVPAALASLPDLWMVEAVWQDRSGRISSTTIVDESERPALRAHLAEATAAILLPLSTDDERKPLMAAVLPDADGVLRARWHN